MKKLNIILLLLVFCGILSCGKDGGEEKIDNKDTSSSNNPVPEAFAGFAYGCDPSWLTPMEQAGIKFYDTDGKETECLTLLKNTGFNAARFRLWVSPKPSGSDGMCDIEDVITKAKRAAALGFAIMIDFHYSDTWADPAKQLKPKNWDKIATVAELAAQVYAYTKESLEKIKAEGINVSWVQIGNETQTGMLKTQSDGSETAINGAMSNSNTNFAQMVNAGNKAVREVFPDAKTIVHLANGQNFEKLSWALGIMKAGNANYDILGVSLYPDFNNKNWYAAYIDACIENLNKISAAYDKDVMICELGTAQIASWNGRRAIVNTVIRAKSEVPRCKGVFYWEPECYSAFNGYAMGGFLSNGSPAPALEVFSGKTTELLPQDDPNPQKKEDDCLILTDKSSGEQIATAGRQDDGTYKATVKVSAAWYNFRVKDSEGNSYGVRNWDSQFSFVKNSPYDNFWFGGETGTFETVFNVENESWSYKVISF